MYISPGQAENMHREYRELQQDSSDESTCYKSGLLISRARGFDFRRFVDGLVRRGQDIDMSAPLSPPYRESLPRLGVRVD